MKFYLITRNENDVSVVQYEANQINNKVAEIMRDGYVENMVAIRGTSYTTNTPKESFKVIQGLTVGVDVVTVEVG